MKRLLAVACLAVAVSGCDLVYRPEEPSPPPAGPPAAFAASLLPAPPMAPAHPIAAAASGPVDSIAGNVTVGPGDSLYRIANAHRVPPRVVVDANKLEPPYRLKIGQVIAIPRIRSYTVQPGDTVQNVSKRTAVDVPTIARLNGLAQPYTLKSGLPLILPPTGGHGGAMPASLPKPVKTIPAASPAPPPQAPVTPASPPPFNGVELPPPAAAPEPAAPVSLPVKGPEKQSSLKPPSTGSSGGLASGLIGGPVKPQADAADATKPAAEPAQTAALSVTGHRPPVAPVFGWPVHGKIVSVFGATPAGAHNDGINIAAPEGTDIEAAESGVVAYTGNEVRGFGNLVLIKHDDGWVTAYAHTAQYRVKRGDKVTRGEPIATVGATGRVSRPQLHFEVRQGTKPLDPLDHLPPPSGDTG